jgi:hypothetical protein
MAGCRNRKNLYHRSCGSAPVAWYPIEAEAGMQLEKENLGNNTVFSARICL